MNHVEQLRDIVRDTPWLLRALRVVRSANIPDAHVCAGAIRNAVWDALHGFDTPSTLKDIDVAYFDAADLSEEIEFMYTLRLCELAPDLPWDVKNQAAVHLWFHEVFDDSVEPLESIAHAASTWPEPAVCVAIRLDPSDAIQVVAPLGLDDLFGMVVRRNPRRVSAANYRARVSTKRYRDRWPRVRVV